MEPIRWAQLSTIAADLPLLAVQNGEWHAFSVRGERCLNAA
jgi:hypothetical protein